MTRRQRWEETPAEQARIVDNLAATAEQAKASARADFAPGEPVSVRITDGERRAATVLRVTACIWCRVVHVQYEDGRVTKVDAARVTRDRAAARRRKGVA